MTPPKKIQPFPKPHQVMNDMAVRTNVKPNSSRSGFRLAGSNNEYQAAINETEAAQAANKLANMKVDFVDKRTGEKLKKAAISADVFNKYVEENFPNVDFNRVKNYILVEDATGSFNDYFIQQKAYDAAQRKAKLQEQSGQDQAPGMGV